MKNANRILALMLALVMCLSLSVAVFAADGDDDSTSPSLTIFKYNFTEAEKDDVEGLDTWESDGTANSDVERDMAPYVVKGVVFSYVRVGDYFFYTGVEDGKAVVMNQYRLPINDTTTGLLSVLGLSASDAHHADSDFMYFDSKVMINALRNKAAAPTALMDASEAFLSANGATPMPETDAYGCTTTAMEEGLYFVAETSVPEYINNVSIPFLIALPLPSPDGSENWVYNATVYPKNWADNPTLEKTLREDFDSSGKNNGPSVGDGYSHNDTASIGDTVNYQIVSTLPTITSNVTRLTKYTYDDTLSKGLTYKKDGITIEWYENQECTEKITEWDQESGKFIVEYGEDGENSTMQIRMSATGLAEINTSTAAHGADSNFHGYSGCTMRILYNCILNDDAVLGSAGNPNTVTLTWSRTNTNYWDTLNDDCHVYSYGIDLKKEFTDMMGNMQKVKFIIQNQSDDYYVLADLEDGVYTVTGKTDKRDEATQFTPDLDTFVHVRGLENDTYLVTEVETDPGHILLTAPVKIEITVAGNGINCSTCGKEGLVASAKVNDVETAMVGDGEDGSSVGARVSLIVKNTPKPDIPKTGDRGTMMYTVIGTLGLLLATMFVVLATRKRQYQ